MNSHREPISRGQGNEFLSKLEAAGLNIDLAQKVIDSKGNALAAEIVILIKNISSKSGTRVEVARALMSNNFFGIEEAIKHFGVNPSKEQLAKLAEVPFDFEVLRACKDTHVLVAVFPLSMIDIARKVDSKLFNSHDDVLCNQQAFVDDKGELGWQLVRKVPLNDSTNKTWNEQQALLSKDEETPKAQVLVYTIIGQLLATRECLFENSRVRCTDLDSDGSRVFVGYFPAGGLHVGNCWDDDRGGSLGVSAARKQLSSTP